MSIYSIFYALFSYNIRIIRGRNVKCWLFLTISLICCGLSVVPAYALDYPTKVLYLRDLGTKYTGETISFTAEIITLSGKECIGCKVWFYVDGPNWQQSHWIGPTAYSDYSVDGIYTTQWTIPPGASEGTYTYLAMVQDSDLNARSANSNEYTFRVLKETMSAHVISIWPVDDIKAGGSVALWAQVQNTGPKALDLNCKVKFLVKGTLDEESTDYYAGTRNCVTDDWAGNKDILRTGETRWYKIDWTPPAAGRYTYWASVEYDNREISDTPPTYSFNVLEPRNAAIDSLATIDDTRTGSGVSLGALVENTADIILNIGCRIGFYAKGPEKAGKKMEGFIGFQPCDQNDSNNPEPLLYQEKRWYTIKWTPPMAGNYTYQAVVEYGGTDISKWSSIQSFHVGDDVTTTTLETPQEPTETIPPTTEPQEETTTTTEETTTTSPSTTTTTPTTTTTEAAQAPEAVGQVTGINLGSPLISFIATAVTIYLAAYLIYAFSKRRKKETKTEEQTTKKEALRVES